MKKLLIVSSVYNEEKNIEDFINEIYKQFENFKKNLTLPIALELILVNNKSQDKSLEKMIELKNKFLFEGV